jgi:hypothetical protein
MFKVILSITTVALLVSPSFAAEASKEARIAMVNVNSSFLTAHAVARKINLAHGGPVVLLRSGNLVLLHKGQETTVKAIPQAYHTYKTFAHLGPTIYLMLGPPGVGNLSDERLQQIDRYRAKLQHLGKHIDSVGLTGAALTRQKKMLTRCMDFLAKVQEAKQLSMEELLAFTRSMTPMIKANLDGAAKAQIDGMHQQMMLWKKELTPAEWSKLRVVIKGAVFARKDNLAKQYFQKLLGLSGEGRRLAYMELYFPPTPMQTLIAIRGVDGGLAVAFFADPDRMFRDALADAATAYLKKTPLE